MNYAKDPNQIASEYARREPSPGYSTPVVWGTLTIWRTLWGMARGEEWVSRSNHVHLDIKPSGVVIAYHEDGVAEIFYPEPGWYVNFQPDHAREGE